MLLEANYSGCLVHLEETHPFYHPSGTEKPSFFGDSGSFHSSRVGVILGGNSMWTPWDLLAGKRKIIWKNSGSSVLPGSAWSTDSLAQDASHRQPDLALHPPPALSGPRRSLPLVMQLEGLVLAAHVLMALQRLLTCFSESQNLLFQGEPSADRFKIISSHKKYSF